MTGRGSSGFLGRARCGVQEFGGTGKAEPIAFATDFGKGRGFTLLLGHDVRAMASDGFKALLLRGTEWAATGKVLAETIKP